MDAKTPKPLHAAPDWMVHALEVSDAQVDAGMTVPVEPVLERARASITRIKAVLANGQKARPET